MKHWSQSANFWPKKYPFLFKNANRAPASKMTPFFVKSGTRIRALFGSKWGGWGNLQSLFNITNWRTFYYYKYLFIKSQFNLHFLSGLKWDFIVISIYEFRITYMARILTCPRGQVTEIFTCPPGLSGQVGQGGNP